MNKGFSPFNNSEHSNIDLGEKLRDKKKDSSKNAKQERLKEEINDVARRAEEKSDIESRGRIFHDFFPRFEFSESGIQEAQQEFQEVLRKNGLSRDAFLNPLTTLAKAAYGWNQKESLDSFDENVTINGHTYKLRKPEIYRGFIPSPFTEKHTVHDHTAGRIDSIDVTDSQGRRLEVNSLAIHFGEDMGIFPIDSISYQDAEANEAKQAGYNDWLEFFHLS